MIRNHEFASPGFSAAILTGGFLLAGSWFGAADGWSGTLTPPGAPAPTMKTLSEIEPRRAIDTVPPGSNARHLITEPGSYYLTGNIDLSTAAPGILGGVWITTVGVTLDLKGFTIQGTSASIAGVISQGPGFKVTNGTIQGFSTAGIYSFMEDATIEGINLFSTGRYGVYAGGGNTAVRGCHVDRIEGVGGECIGIFTGERGSIVENNSVSYVTATGTDTAAGIWTDRGAVVRHNRVWVTTSDSGDSVGIHGGEFSNVTNNSSLYMMSESGDCYALHGYHNSLIADNSCGSITSFGAGTACIIFGKEGSTVRGNNCSVAQSFSGDAFAIQIEGHGRAEDNDCYAVYATAGIAHGISAGERSLVQGNRVETVSGNSTAAGILAAAASRTLANHVTDAEGAGIEVNGSKAVVLSNTVHGSGVAGQDIYFAPATLDGYAAANITDTAITQGAGGANNLSATTPAPNAVY